MLGCKCLCAEKNLKIFVYYLKHTERVQRVPTVASITLDVVRGYREKQLYKEKFKKILVEPEINDKDWHLTMKSIREYLAAQNWGERVHIGLCDQTRS
jgi:hypothetical protein